MTKKPNDELLPCPKEGDVIVVWFSNGAASAVALDETLRRYGNLCKIRAVNNPVINEDSDNLRFQEEISERLNIKIEHAFNKNYPSGDCREVWAHRKWMSGAGKGKKGGGAPCTVELKKVARAQWEAENHFDWLVLGFTADEKKRYDRFILTERGNVLPVLIEKGITKDDCYQRIREYGIELPRSYSTSSRFGSGFPNANCIGCVKATSPTYWNHVRETHPEIFKERADQSRGLGAKLVRVKNKRIYLDDLDPDARGRDMKTMKTECGIFCEEKIK